MKHLILFTFISNLCLADAGVEKFPEAISRKHPVLMSEIPKDDVMSEKGTLRIPMTDEEILDADIAYAQDCTKKALFNAMEGLNPTAKFLFQQVMPLIPGVDAMSSLARLSIAVLLSPTIEEGMDQACIGILQEGIAYCGRHSQTRLLKHTAPITILVKSWTGGKIVPRMAKKFGDQFIIHTVKNASARSKKSLQTFFKDFSQEEEEQKRARISANEEAKCNKKKPRFGSWVKNTYKKTKETVAGTLRSIKKRVAPGYRALKEFVTATVKENQKLLKLLMQLS